MLGKHALRPGEKTELEVTFPTINAPGPFEKIVTIYIDVPEKKQYEVIMTGNVKEAAGAKIAVTSRKVELGDIKQGETKKQNILVKNPGELPLIIYKASTKVGSSVSVSVNALPVTIAGGQTADVELSIVVSKQGTFAERIFIESNAKNATKSGFVIQVSGKAE